MVDVARYAFNLAAWNELAGVDDHFTLFCASPARARATSRTRTARRQVGFLRNPRWRRPQCTLTPAFRIADYVRNNGTHDIEIVDPKHKRRQLSRIAYPHLKAEDVRPNGKLVIYGKQYSVLDYADTFTRDSLGKSQQT
jgi:hypothetical protein